MTSDAFGASAWRGRIAGMIPSLLVLAFCVLFPTFCIWLGVRFIRKPVLKKIAIGVILIQFAMIAFLLIPYFGFDHAGDWGLDINHQVLGALVYWLVAAGGTAVAIVMKKWWLVAAQIVVAIAVIARSFGATPYLSEVQVAAGCIVGATFVSEIVRWINRRNDPRAIRPASIPDGSSKSN